MHALTITLKKVLGTHHHLLTLRARHFFPQRDFSLSPRPLTLRKQPKGEWWIPGHTLPSDFHKWLCELKLCSLWAKSLRNKQTTKKKKTPQKSKASRFWRKETYSCRHGDGSLHRHCEIVGGQFLGNQTFVQWKGFWSPLAQQFERVVSERKNDLCLWNVPTPGDGTGLYQFDQLCWKHAKCPGGEARAGQKPGSLASYMLWFTQNLLQA